MRCGPGARATTPAAQKRCSRFMKFKLMSLKRLRTALTTLEFALSDLVSTDGKTVILAMKTSKLQQL
jgi:hypothetical protein